MSSATGRAPPRACRRGSRRRPFPGARRRRRGGHGRCGRPSGAPTRSCRRPSSRSRSGRRLRRPAPNRARVGRSLRHGQSAPAGLEADLHAQLGASPARELQGQEGDAPRLRVAAPGRASRARVASGRPSCTVSMPATAARSIASRVVRSACAPPVTRCAADRPALPPGREQIVDVRGIRPLDGVVARPPSERLRPRRLALQDHVAGARRSDEGDRPRARRLEGVASTSKSGLAEELGRPRRLVLAQR